jgi:hypothetical protein
MLVTDDANYQKWATHGDPTYLMQKTLSDGDVFSFAASRDGLYHILLDNTNSPIKKRVTLTVDTQKQVLLNVPDERVRYVAYAAISIGSLVAVIGILRKTQIPWA